MELPTEWIALVSIASGISALVACVKVIRSPLDKINKNEKDIQELQKQADRRKEIDKAMLFGLQSITNHMIDGNGVDALKQSRNELQRAIGDIATK